MARKRSLFYIAIQSLVRCYLNISQTIQEIFIVLKHLQATKAIVVFLVGIFLVVGISPVFSQIPASRLNNPHSLVREGELLYRQQDLLRALEYFEKAVDIFAQREDKLNKAITLTNLGRLQLELGKANNALDSWKTAKTIYVGLGDKTGVTRSQIYQAHVLQKLGFYPRACGILLQTLEIPEQTCEALTKNKLQNTLEKKQEILEQPNPLLLNAWRNLGDILRSTGKLNESRFILEKIARIDSSPNQAATLLSLGNTFTALGNLELQQEEAEKSPKDTIYDYQPWYCSRSDYILPDKVADKYKSAESKYQQVIEEFPTKTTAIKAKLNLLRLWLLRNKFKSSLKNDTTGLLSKTEILLSQINISNVPTNQTQIYTQINLAKSRACLTQLKDNQPHWENIVKELKIAQYKAKEIGDNSAKSYAVGNLGGLYEFYAWWLEKNPHQVKNVKDNLCQTVNDYRKKAQKFTQEALHIAQPTKEPFIAYQLQSQLGRLLDKQGKREDAIAAYNGAINTLESVSDNLFAIDSDVQFSFLENIEPVYRNFLGLLLEDKANEANLKRATEVSEKLQLEELKNLLRCSLDFSKTIHIDNLDRLEEFGKPPAAIIHPILFQNRVEVIVQITSKENSTQKIYRYNNEFSQEEFSNALSVMRSIERSDLEQVKTESKKLYNWLMKCANSLPNFPQSGTLVFVVDSTLQGLPFAVLYDGEHYLVEKYSIVTNSTSQLLNSRNLKPEKRNALLAGISEKADSFNDTDSNDNLDPLPNVKQELEAIQKTVKSRVLENKEFTKRALEKEINAIPFSIVHLATHGKFSSNREETYIYAWDEKIKLDELDRILRSRGEVSSKPIELLVLSACETGKGDRRAALGIAGVSLKAEARSTIATLWKVNDDSTSEFMKLFYQELSKPNVTKAEALRKVQIHFLEDLANQDPYFWAPFILVGNWL